MAPLILASRSPQRRAILEQLGVDFEVLITDVEELETGPPHEVAVENAYRKAAAAAAADAQRPVLGVDTIVSIGSRVWGKPVDEADARDTLRALGGPRHTVISGLCVIDGGRTRTAAATTEVQFRALDDALTDWDLASGEWGERAGGYPL